MYFNIQILRGFSALLVVAFHLLPHFRDMGLKNNLYESIAQYGYVGVDIFFVISGFVMAHTLNSVTYGTDSALVFIKKRLLRIYSGYLPTYLLALCVYLTFSPDFLTNISLLDSLLLSTIDMNKLLIGTSWSLSYEMYFYLVLALILSQNKIKATPVLSLVLILIVIKNIFHQEVNDKNLSDFILSHLMIEFILGFILYQCMRFIHQIKYLVMVIPCLIISLLFGVSILIENNWTRVATFGVFAFCLLWLLIFLESRKFRVQKGLFLSIGNASYSLYLLHIIFVNLFYSTGLRTYLKDNDIALIGFVLYFFLIVFISLIFYKYIEHPLYKLLQRKILLR